MNFDETQEMLRLDRSKIGETQVRGWPQIWHTKLLALFLTCQHLIFFRTGYSARGDEVFQNFIASFWVDSLRVCE